MSYPASEAASVRLTLELAAALGNGTTDAFIADLEAEGAEWAAQRPGPVLPTLR